MTPLPDDARPTAVGSAVKVLYIAGWQRSGSTLAANLMGELPGYFHAGELYYLWDYVWHDNTLCGCGRRFHDCPLWSAVIATAYPEGVDADWMRAAATDTTRTRRMAGLAWPASRERRLAEAETFRRSLDRVYRAIATVTGAAVIIDSSKWPSYGLLLDASSAVDLRVLHLVRDPRAVAHSWLRRKQLIDRPDQHLEMYRSPAASSARWLVWNLAVEAYWREPSDDVVRLRYEDLVAAPGRELLAALERLGLPAGSLPLVSSHEARLGPNHTVSGNPDRLRHGVTRIRSDDEWRRSLPVRHRLTVDALTLPLMWRYGYRVRVGV
ncbi:sulfotransferase [Egicoccus sp. AB-alg2]|uniref:sulfotransferase n=1 Tax=Egicoccus sp. AB-alg2 TaxID=3242693 RepID=UPI00359E4C02